MIQLTHFRGPRFFLNAEMILSLESTPDVVITLVNHDKILVRETAEEVAKKMIEYQRMVHNPDLEIQVGE